MAARRIIELTVTALVWLFGVVPVFGASECDSSQLDIRSTNSTTRFLTEVADSTELRALGLMNRESLGTFAGMLFVYPNPHPVGFWMRNTLIPLDMLFIDANGAVAYIHENAIPLDETMIFGGNDIQYVCEINGGMARTLGINVGAAVRHATISGPEVIWSCD